MYTPRGRNCYATPCRRWVPGFADKCVGCGAPSVRRMVANLADFLSGEAGEAHGRAATRPNERVGTVWKALAKPKVVPDRSRDVEIERHLKKGRSIQQIANRLSVSRGAVRRVREKCMRPEASAT